MSATMIITRQYRRLGTMGVATAIHGNLTFTCGVVERPWLSNQVRVSCIPEGEYIVKKRDGSNKRLKYPDAWEVLDVTGRTAILFHPANRPAELMGCLAFNDFVGFNPLSGEVRGQLSGQAFTRFNEFMDSLSEFKLIITS